MQRPSAHPFSLLILLLTNFLDWAAIGLVYPMFSSMIFHPEMVFFPPDTSDIVRGTSLGILLAASPLAQFFSSPIVGTLSDQKGRKPLLRATLLIMILGYILCTLGVMAESLPWLLIGRVVVGIGTGNAAVVYAAIADLSAPEQKAKHFGLASMSSGLGFTLGPFLGGILASFGFATPFLVAGLSSLMNLAFVVFFFRETHFVRRQSEVSVALGFAHLKKSAAIPGVRALFLCVFCFCVGWSFYWEFIPVIWIQEYHLSPPEVGNLYAYGAIFYALSAGLLIRPIVSFFRPLSVLFMSLCLLSVAIFSLLMHSSIDVFWWYIPLQQFLLALLFPTATTIVSNSVKEDMQGEIMGVLQSVDSFAFATSPLLAGCCIGFYADTPIAIAGIAMLLAAGALFATYRTKLFQF